MLQKTWALPSNVGKLNQYFNDLNTHGISSVNDKMSHSGGLYDIDQSLFLQHRTS